MDDEIITDIKIGKKAICIDNILYEDLLEINEEYTVLNITQGLLKCNYYISVENKDKKVVTSLLSRFKPAENNK